MKRSKYFFCYSHHVHKKLLEAGCNFVCKAFTQQQRVFWLYENDEKVSGVLSEVKPKNA